MLSGTSERMPLLIQEIKDKVRENTFNRIRGLRVEEIDGRVVVSGRVPTRHTKQLALHAALELLNPDRFGERIIVG
jgi:hypothetical protein